MASDRPSSDIVFSVKPKASTATNDASTETGSARPVMTVERQELRKRKTTSTVSSAPSTSASSTLRTDAATRTPASRTTRKATPWGRVDCSWPTCARIAAATCVVLKPLAFLTSRPTASSPLNTAAERGSSVPSRASATSPRRMTRPRDWAIGSRVKSAGVSSLPWRRMVRSSNWPLSRPTGAARFCDCSACTTCETLRPADCRSRGRSSTVSSRSTPPTTSTSATPGMPRSRLVMSGSASRVSSGPVIFVDDSTSDMIGRSAGLNRVRIGSSISGGSSLRISEILSRISCVASCRSFSNWKMVMITP